MIMSRLYSYVMAGPRRGRVLLTACASGEIHELGMRMVADFFEIEGWDTCHLGANTPADGLVDFVAQRKPNLFGLSATMTFHLEAVATIIVALRGSPETRGVTIMVGGHAFNREPGLWREIGADCYARDAESALVVANSLPIGSLG
jgi:methanogenic corrinoid protein MtbC1